MPINYRTTKVTATPYTVDQRDEVVFVDVSRPAEIILPTRSISPEPADTHQVYYIKDISGQAGTNPITITSEDREPIDGVSFAILNVGYSHIQVVYDGRNWWTIS